MPTLADDASDEPDEGEAADNEHTVVVFGRAAPRVLARLVLDNGTSYDLTAETVAVGRKPADPDPSVQNLSVADPTRTLSKQHARLHLTNRKWTISDLGSTNGVVVFERGEERQLGIGEIFTVEGRFELGRVGMRVEDVS